MKLRAACSFFKSGWPLWTATLVLAGCAGVPQWEKPGAPRADVIKRLGPPSAEYALPSGERLQYSQEPAGTQVYNLDFDAGGRLLSVDQVLEFEKFNRIVPDQWSAADVERMFGKPAQIERVMSFQGDIWTYRYQDFSGYRRLHIFLDASGRVRKWLTTDEPLPDGPETR